jgi:formate hydrogenlyase subunit 3/multisubunit Na+/H+ antiporter MnhD subunit
MHHFPFGAFLVLSGAALIAGARFTTSAADGLNGQVRGRKRIYLLIGVGFIIVGIAVLAGVV